MSDDPRPGERVVERWRLAADALGMSGGERAAYVRFWRSFWRRTVLELMEQGTWEPRDERLLAEFVEWSRLADFHARAAAAAPYVKSSASGRVFAHPGWRLEREARREARLVADRLLLGVAFGDDDAPFDQVGL